MYSFHQIQTIHRLKRYLITQQGRWRCKNSDKMMIITITRIDKIVIIKMIGIRARIIKIYLIKRETMDIEATERIMVGNRQAITNNIQRATEGTREYKMGKYLVSRGRATPPYARKRPQTFELHSYVF